MEKVQIGQLPSQVQCCCVDLRISLREEKRNGDGFELVFQKILRQLKIASSKLAHPGRLLKVGIKCNNLKYLVLVKPFLSECFNLIATMKLVHETVFQADMEVVSSLHTSH